MKYFMSVTKVGISVECVVCLRKKAPRGRSVPIGAYLCEANNCSGFYAHPYPGDLWPGETDEDFGYVCSDNATRKL